eukprot:5134412-Ditylum_brightwellii.AAC.1
MISVLKNFQKHYKSKDAESGSGFDPPAIRFIPKASNLKMEIAQEFTLQVSLREKKSTYNPEDILELEKKLNKVIKNKPVDTADGCFDLVEALLEGDALTHWQKFKRVETSRTSKNPDGTDTSPEGMCDNTFK